VILSGSLPFPFRITCGVLTFAKANESARPFFVYQLITFLKKENYEKVTLYLLCTGVYPIF
jgi:hypothetical protein